MKKQNETSTAYSDICEIKKRLIDMTKTELNNGIEKIDAKELGEVVDMIKDLAEAEAKHFEACYYESIVDAMEEDSKDPYSDRMGFRSRVMPHKPFRYDEPYSDAYLYDNDPSNIDRRFRMGYRGSSNSNDNRGNPNQSRDSMGRFTSDSNSGRSGYDGINEWRQNPDEDPHYSRAVNQYKSARRHYSETHSQMDKEEMNRHANEHIADTIQTIKEMWEDADPTLRKKMKADLTSLVGTMNA